MVNQSCDGRGRATDAATGSVLLVMADTVVCSSSVRFCSWTFVYSPSFSFLICSFIFLRQDFMKLAGLELAIC